MKNAIWDKDDSNEVWECQRIKIDFFNSWSLLGDKNLFSEMIDHKNVRVFCVDQQLHLVDTSNLDIAVQLKQDAHNQVWRQSRVDCLALIGLN